MYNVFMVLSYASLKPDCESNRVFSFLGVQKRKMRRVHFGNFLHRIPKFKITFFTQILALLVPFCIWLITQNQNFDKRLTILETENAHWTRQAIEQDTQIDNNDNRISILESKINDLTQEQALMRSHDERLDESIRSIYGLIVGKDKKT